MDNTTVSYWIRSVEDTTAPLMELVDVRLIRDGLSAMRVRVADSILWIPADQSFAERYDVVQRVSENGPADAYRYLVTFVNHDFTSPGGRRPEVQVELKSSSELEITGAADVEGLAWEAAEVWPTAGWGGDEESSWWCRNVILPDGTVLDWTV